MGAMNDFGLDLAIIGNCHTVALLEPTSRLVWWCYPRFDSDPIFSRLLAGDEEKGFCDVVLENMVGFSSSYERNTAIVSTILTDAQGAAVKIIDFAPRFRQYGRIFRPVQLIRTIEPIAGIPQVAIRVRPTNEYGKPIDDRALGSNHITFQGKSVAIRLTTDGPLAYIDQESSFALTKPIHMILGPDEPFAEDIGATCREFADRTRDFWMEWVRGLSIAYDWQDPIIRAAITLKLSNFEETGAIVAALTTSIPEAPRSGRTWDYRYCWLRDAYFVVKALNRLGATETMESFISFILGIAAQDPLRPVYGIVPTERLDEVVAPNLKGYRNDGPVRVGNEAALQHQHDAFGSIVLAAMPMFFDRRLPRPGNEGLFHFLESLGLRAAKAAFTPDAGIWEYRSRAQIHTYSAAMCWAASSRLAAIATHLGLDENSRHWTETASKIQDVLLEQAWNEKKQAFTSAFGSEDLDASVLLLPDIGLIEPTDPRFTQTVAAVEKDLLNGKHVMRYANNDDFGLPEVAFLACRYWLIDAWWSLGRREEARELFVDSLRYRNSYGLLAEDIHPVTGELWGNFPQTYSMAGLILTAMRLSRSWEDRYWRG
jgi:GH15 family glucan-1,4-alpha-glucosidase